MITLGNDRPIITQLRKTIILFPVHDSAINRRIYCQKNTIGIFRNKIRWVFSDAVFEWHVNCSINSVCMADRNGSNIDAIEMERTTDFIRKFSCFFFLFQNNLKLW